MAEAVEIIEDDPIEVRRAKREALIAAGISSNIFLVAKTVMYPS